MTNPGPTANNENRTGYDIFISYADADKLTAQAVCARLESVGVRCWIAPRDIVPGADWTESIIDGIAASKALVLVFSAKANASKYVQRELSNAMENGLTVIPFRIENIKPTGSVKFFLATVHWLDAFTPPLDIHLETLASRIKQLLGAEGATVKTASTTAVPAAAKLIPAPAGRTWPLKVALTVIAFTVFGVAGYGILKQLRAHSIPSATKPPEALNQVASNPSTNEPTPSQPLERHAVQPGKPWENSLGMKFMPVPGTAVLFCIWDTRVQDFEAFVKDTGYDATAGMLSMGSDGWKAKGATWKNPGFKQGPTHPVVGVCWNDAMAFCLWLTKKEQAAELIGRDQSYRLPTDLQWSCAAGLGKEVGDTPKARNLQVDGVYPWGKTWPPPKGAGNYAGREARTTNWPPDRGTIEGYDDGYAVTSPVGSFQPNQYGLFDMGGNVWQECIDSYDEKLDTKVGRGAAWDNDYPNSLLSSYRGYDLPTVRADYIGFRIVLEVSSP